MADKLQSQRFELKYIIDEQRASAIRDFVRSYLVADEFNGLDPATLDPEDVGLQELISRLHAQNLLEGFNGSYWVNSLYVDSPSLRLAHATIEGNKNRFKLRIRFYDEKKDSPVFFEIKQRKNDVIQKQRAMVHRASADALLSDHVPGPRDLVRPNDGKALYALRRFFEMKNEIRASGIAFVSFLREAYVSTISNNVRVTFDRALAARPYHDTIFMPQGKDVVLRPRIGVNQNNAQDVSDPVILELKFTDRFPRWMHELVETFNLRRGAMPKYVECVHSLRKGTLEDLNPLMQTLREELI